MLNETFPVIFKHRAWVGNPKRHFLLSIVCLQSFPSSTPYHLFMTSSANWHTAKHQKMKGTKKKLQNLLRVFSVYTKNCEEIKIIHHWNPFSHIVWQITTHCSKSSFFVQKFNFNLPRKLSIFLSEKLVKMLRFC